MAGQRKILARSDTITLPLSPQDNNLIIAETAFFQNGSARRLFLAPVHDGHVMHRLTFDELEELADSIAHAAKFASKREIGCRLDRVLDHIEQRLNGFKAADYRTVTPKKQEPQGLGLAMLRLAVGGRPADGTLPDDLTILMKQQAKFAENRVFTADIEKVMARVEDHLHKPLSEIGGLTPAQFSRLINDDWQGSGFNIVKLAKDLSKDSFKKALILRRSLTMLDLLGTEEGVKATARGNLPRKFVSQISGLLDLPRGYLDKIHARKKVINEKDLPPLHVVRVLLELSGCIELTQGYFKVTRKGLALSNPRKSGELFALLFRVHFHEFNLSYLDDMQEAPILQNVIAYSLYTLAKLPNKWRHPDQLAKDLILKKDVLGAPYPFWNEQAHNMLVSRLLRPLLGFGLLEKRFLPSRETLTFLKPFEVRRTRLFDRFLRFNLD